MASNGFPNNAQVLTARAQFSESPGEVVSSSDDGRKKLNNINNFALHTVR